MGATFIGLTSAHSPVEASGGETAFHLTFSGTTEYSEQWVGGTGEFAFSTGPPLGCTAVGTMAGQVMAGNCTMWISGTFTSLACGTASALGTANLWTPAGSISFDLGIDTVAFVGVVIPGRWNQTYSVEGVIKVEPTNLLTLDPFGPVGASECTPGFTVNGDVAVVQVPSVSNGAS